MKNVLIVEDNIDLQNIYKIAFGAANIPVVIKSNGLEAIAEITEIDPAIILLDLLMPDLDGFKFMELMKEKTSLNIPVIVCSNLSDEKSRQKCSEYGCYDYLIKADVDISDIVKKVQKFFAEHKE